jgi:hypothetical protein
MRIHLGERGAIGNGRRDAVGPALMLRRLRDGANRY